MPPPAWYAPGDPALARAIDVTWTLARRADPRRLPRGVQRFRSPDDMHRAQEARDAEHVRRLRARRTGLEP
jgi:hypothetical protein